MIREGSVPNNASVVLDVDAPGMGSCCSATSSREAAHQVLLALRRDPRTRATSVRRAQGGAPRISLQDPQLVAAAHPVGVISVGAGNAYGHPAPSTLALLRGAGTAAFRTDQRGDIAGHPRRRRIRASPHDPPLTALVTGRFRRAARL